MNLRGDAVSEIRARPRPAGVATKIVAIDGPGGAGKSTFAALLAEALYGAPIVHTDDFASWEEPVDWWPRLLAEVLEPLARGEPAHYRPTAWGGAPTAEIVIAAGRPVVLEGVTAARAASRPYLTYSIWIETPRAERLRRELERDGSSARGAWERWMAAEDAYVERERPTAHVDAVVRGDRPLTAMPAAILERMSAPTKIVLDCDPGHDDAIALLLALASPEVELLGVTTVCGNQTLDKTTANALRVLEFVGRDDVPVHAGADRPLVRDVRVAAHVHGESGLDGPDLPPPAGTAGAAHAVDFLAEQIRAHDGAVTLVPTGPLTNVALLLALHPDARPERIVLMGGSIGEGNITPEAEFNVWADPEAAKRVFAAGLDTTMVGLDATHRALITADHAERLRGAGRVGRMVAELLDFYLRFHRTMYPELGGSPMHDPVALAETVHPGLLELREAEIDVDCSWGTGRGRTSVDWRGRGGFRPNARVAVDVDGGAFAELLLERLASLG